MKLFFIDTFKRLYSHRYFFIGTFLLSFSIFFPYNIVHYKGSYIDFNLLNKYADLAEFLAFPIGILSLILIYLTFHSQKEELSQTTKTLKQQQFETTLFNLLNLKNNSYKNLNNDEFDKELYLQIRYANFSEFIEKSFLEYDNNFNDLNKFDVKNFNYYTNTSMYIAFRTFYIKYLEEQLKYSPYETNLFKKHYNLIDSIFDLILMNEKFFNQYSIYKKLINSSFSQHESLLYFYHCYGYFDLKKAKKIVEYFDLFESINESDMIKFDIFDLKKL